jgi:small-conductance mechanosensitive channel
MNEASAGKYFFLLVKKKKGIVTLKKIIDMVNAVDMLTEKKSYEQFLDQINTRLKHVRLIMKVVLVLMVFVALLFIIQVINQSISTQSAVLDNKETVLVAQPPAVQLKQ